MLANFFDLSFFQNILSNALATLAGVFIALLLDRWVYEKREKKTETGQAQTAKKRKYEFLNVVWLMLQQNYDILDHIMSSGFKPTDAIVLNVDAQYFEVTAALKYEILDDLLLNGYLEIVRVDLRQLHDFISLQLETGYSPKREENIIGFVGDREVLMDEITKRITTAKKHLSTALDKVVSAIAEIKSERSE